MNENLERLKLISNNSKYFIWYSNLIEKALTRKTKKTKFSNHEKHHIYPKCFGGADSKENYAILESREHFICHVLLIKILDNSYFKNKMVFALNMLRRNPSKNHIRYFNSRFYDSVRQKFKDAQRLRQIEFMADPIKKKKSIEKRKATYAADPSISARISYAAKNQDRSIQKIGKRGLKGPDRTDAQKEASKNRIGGWASSKKGKKMLSPAWNKGKKMPEHMKAKFEIVSCPFCKKFGKGNSMKRWHFDKCKSSPNYRHDTPTST